jgi:hypothetical protein
VTSWWWMLSFHLSGISPYPRQFADTAPPLSSCCKLVPLLNEVRCDDVGRRVGIDLCILVGRSTGSWVVSVLSGVYPCLVRWGGDFILIILAVYRYSIVWLRWKSLWRWTFRKHIVIIGLWHNHTQRNAYLMLHSVQFDMEKSRICL